MDSTWMSYWMSLWIVMDVVDVVAQGVLPSAFYRWDSASTGVSSEVDLVLKVSRYLQIQAKQNRIKS